MGRDEIQATSTLELGVLVGHTSLQLYRVFHRLTALG
jgi:hypothetical protein